MTLPRAVRYMIWERDNGVCGICTLPVPFGPLLHIDHILPIAGGGSDLPANLRATHAACNMQRGADGYQALPPGRETITTSFRMTPTLRDQVKRVAQKERRTTNDWVRIVLEDAVESYLSEHPELAEPGEERYGQ